MSEPSPNLTEQAAAAVLAVPGVLRLEPTLRNAVRHLASAAPDVARSGGSGYTAAEGIRISHRTNRVDCHVDIVVDRSRPAVDVAHDVQTTLRTLLGRHQPTVGAITVAVLNLAP